MSLAHERRGLNTFNFYTQLNSSTAVDQSETLKAGENSTSFHIQWQVGMAT